MSERASERASELPLISDGYTFESSSALRREAPFAVLGVDD